MMSAFKHWSRQEDVLLLLLYNEFKTNWHAYTGYFQDRTAASIRVHWYRLTRAYPKKAEKAPEAPEATPEAAEQAEEEDYWDFLLNFY
jgi:hypothetical protein